MRIFRTSHLTASAVTLWMLVLPAAATELRYEKLQPHKDSEYTIENENKLDYVAAYDQIDRAEDDLKKSRLLVTLLQYVQNRKDIANGGSPPKDEDEVVIWSDFFRLKEAGVKRWMAALSNNASSKFVPRWKIKKGSSFDAISEFT